MNTIQCLYYHPVICGCDCVYSGITCDSHYFYLTCPKKCEIIKFDKCFKKKKAYKVCKPYSSICYDECSKCFWALSVCDKNKIYKLDTCFNEIDCISVQIEDCYCIQLTGISCKDYCTLIVCGNFGVAEISKCNGKYIKTIYEDSICIQYTSVCFNAPGLITSMKRSQINIIEWNNLCDCDLTKCCLPDCYEIKDLAICCCNQKYYLFVLVTKSNCYSYVLCCELSTVCENPCCDDCCCNSCCDCCDDPCHDKCEESDCKKGAADIIESIALVEAALSHILNAEGEKIQKILCQSDDPCEIMQVNEAVKKTITSITHLEQVLYAKLQTAQELCNTEECSKPQDCC